jgi:hypothetical protein
VYRWNAPTRAPAGVAPARRTRAAAAARRALWRKRRAAADRAPKPLRSSSEPLVAIVKSADLRKGDDPTLIRRLYQARLWAILCEGEVGPGVVLIPQVGRQKPPEVVFAQDNDVIEAVALD